MNSIRARLLVLLLIGIGVVLVGGGWAVYWVEGRSLTSQFDQSLRTKAQVLAGRLALEPTRRGIELKFDSGDGLVETIGTALYEIRTEHGELLTQSARLNNPLPIRVPPEGAFAAANVELDGGEPGRAVWMSFHPLVEDDDDDGESANDDDVSVGTDGEQVGEMLVVTVAAAQAPIREALAALVWTLMIVGVGVAAVLGVIVTLGVRWGMAPLTSMRRQLERIDGRKMSERFNVADAPDELLPVYRELNGMLDRVEQTIERERSFADAAAHELRTPLAELRSAAEVAIRWPNLDEALVALNETKSIGSEMERVVESLLLISRGKPGATNGEASHAPLHAVLADCVSRSAPLIRDRDLQIDITLNGCAEVAVPRNAAEIILRNLIDNAIRYSPRGGHVNVSGSSDGGVPVIEVINGPVDLDEHDVDRLFEPFWQKDHSRSDRVHVGLGLAVVRQVAEATGHAVNARLQGSDLCVRLVLTDQDAPSRLASINNSSRA